eukprot:TRINITY_DN36673_c0_g1_i1.p2 TRINITY_DN36673_c0_g1~~TRINITY_DN36673_c0_g1_i1.p2  ORF type:complete len:120 (+),score=16.07 TRINITY_DN36673_c0_g1_i1:130-489(+)
MCKVVPSDPSKIPGKAVNNPQTSIHVPPACSKFYSYLHLLVKDACIQASDCFQPSSPGVAPSWAIWTHLKPCRTLLLWPSWGNAETTMGHPGSSQLHFDGILGPLGMCLCMRNWQSTSC